MSKKIKQTPKQTPVVDAPPTQSDIIWSEIKNLPMDVFSLPNQTVSQHVKRFPSSPDMVFVKLSSSAIIAALEYALGKKYTLEISEAGFIMIRRAPPPVVIPKEAEPFVIVGK